MNNLSLKQKLFFLNLIILIFLIIFSPAISLADADKIFKENSKAVVIVVAYDDKGNPISQGSGFIVRTDGAIITNYHVISNAKDIKIKAGDKVLRVEGLIHADKENDIVILKAKGEKLPTVKIGDIRKASVGEKVYVISSPRGFENTISDGILSGIREIEGTNKKILQITAPVSPGSSGGPVFNKNGEVIGIATFIIEEAQNLNFAMPVNLIKDKISSKKVTALKDSEIEDYKKTAEYWFYVGVAYENLDMYKEAIDAYQQAIRIKPDFAVGYSNLGVAYNNLGMHREAIEALKQAIKIKPDFTEAHNNLGVAYGGLGMHREEITAYRQAITINPGYEKAHYNLGVAYGQLGMYKEAVEALKQAIRIEPDDAEVHNNLGIAYRMLGMDKEAIETLKQAIRIKPDYAKAHYNLGVIYLLLGDKGSALDEYKILKDLDPEKANVLFNLIYK